MITFKEFLKEEKEIKLIELNEFNDIGWWKKRNDFLILYHGTNKINLDGIVKNGITNKDPETGFISMALEPNTAFAYASMTGGESNFRKMGAKAKIAKIEDRVCIVFKVPIDFVKKHFDKNLSGNIGVAKKRMSDEDEYQKFNGSDFLYYQLAELRFDEKIPPKFIIGYMKK